MIGLTKTKNDGTIQLLIEIQEYNYRVKKPITEKELRGLMIPHILTKPTFYRYWEEVKKQKLVKGIGEDFEIHLTLTEKGRKMLEEHTEKVVIPAMRRAEKEGTEFLIKKLHQKNLFGKWIPWSMPKNFKSEEEQRFYMLLKYELQGSIILNEKLIEIKFKINKEELEKDLVKLGVLFKEKVKHNT